MESRTTQSNRTAVILQQELVPDVGYAGDEQVVVATLISTTAGPRGGTPAAYPRQAGTHARMYAAYLHAHAGQPCLSYFRYHISGRSRRHARSMTRIVATAGPDAVALFLFVSISLPRFRPRGSPPAPTMI